MDAPLVVVVDRPPFAEDPSDAAADLRGRAEKLAALGPAVGVEVVVVPEGRLGTDAALEPALRRASAVFWVSRLAFVEATTALVVAIRARLAAAGRADVPVLDDPDAADEAFDLSRFYPLLEAAGVPQAGTRFLPVSVDEAKLDEEPLRALLAERIAAANLEFPEDGVFYRTHFGTLKIASGLNGAFSAEELAEGGARLVTRLRTGQSIGGIAVREMLPIPVRWLKKGRAVVRREVRVFCVFGAPVAWALCGSHADYRVEKIPLETLAEVVGMTPALAQEVRAVSLRAASALRARFLVIDVTILSDGRVVVLETNPGFGCHWYHPAVFVAAYAAMLRRAAGLAPLSGEARDEALSRLGVEVAGRGAVYGFFEESS